MGLRSTYRYDLHPTLRRAQNSENVDLTLADFFGLHDQNARALLSESDYATRGDKRTLSTYTDAITNAVRLYQAAVVC